MKKCVWILIFLVGLGSFSKAKAQAEEIEQLLLNVEKLAQLKNILEDLKKGYEIVFSGYTTIKNISEGNFQLHDLFLDGLLEVSPVVKKYKRVADIISTQVKLVKEYKIAYRQFSGSGLFTPDEISYLAKVYANLFQQSLKNLDALATVLTSGELRMTDDERLAAIDAVWKEAEDQIVFLRHFNRENKILALQRVKEGADISTLKKLHSKSN